MHTMSSDTPLGRTRRTYSASFKTELVEQCRQIGVSCSAVAISHGMNPNVLRRWIKEADAPNAAAVSTSTPNMDDIRPAFVALPMIAPTPRLPEAAQVNVRIEIQRHGATVSVLWPLARLSDSASWVREVLQ